MGVPGYEKLTNLCKLLTEADMGTALPFSIVKMKTGKLFKTNGINFFC